MVKQTCYIDSCTVLKICDLKWFLCKRIPSVICEILNWIPLFKNADLLFCVVIRQLGVPGTHQLRSLVDFLFAMFIEKCFLWVLHSTNIMLTCLQLFENNDSSFFSLYFNYCIPRFIVYCSIHETICLYLKENTLTLYKIGVTII